MKTIKELLAAYDAKEKDLNEVLDPIQTAKEEDRRELTEEEETRAAEIEGEMDSLAARISELRAKEERSNKVREARKLAQTTATTDMSVVDEPKVYGTGSSHSFVADLVSSSTPGFSGFRAARERMEQYEYQVSVEIARDSTEGKRAIESIKEARRSHDGRSFRETIEELRERGNAGSQNGLESRAMSSGAGSGGSFVTPVYFIQEWAPYRTPGRAFIDACNKQTMPDYGRGYFALAR